MLCIYYIDTNVLEICFCTWNFMNAYSREVQSLCNNKTVYILKQCKDYGEIFECVIFNLTKVPDVN